MTIIHCALSFTPDRGEDPVLGDRLLLTVAGIRCLVTDEFPLQNVALRRCNWRASVIDPSPPSPLLVPVPCPCSRVRRALEIAFGTEEGFGQPSRPSRPKNILRSIGWRQESEMVDARHASEMTG